jgi:hypothetical protein
MTLGDGALRRAQWQTHQPKPALGRWNKQRTTMKKLILKTTLLAATLALPMSANAALLGRDINGAAVAGNDVNSVFLYDDVLNVTWLRDANFAQTSGYDSDGKMNWSAANIWAANLVVGVFADWRLPTLKPVNGTTFNYNLRKDGTSDFGYAATGTGWGTASEMGHLYYVTLSNKGYYTPDAGEFTGYETPQTGWGLFNKGDFQNLQADFYWSDLEYAPKTDSAWFSYMGDGAQARNEKFAPFLALAVLDGDVLVSAVPEPETYALMLAGLAVVGAAARRRKAVNTGSKKAAP